jgi:cobalamin synthase
MAWLAMLAEPSVVACVVLTIVSATVTAITLLAPQWCCKRLGGVAGDVAHDDDDGGETPPWRR